VDGSEGAITRELTDTQQESASEQQSARSVCLTHYFPLIQQGSGRRITQQPSEVCV
jgi:hypothetical protein